MDPYQMLEPYFFISFWHFPRIILGTPGCSKLDSVYKDIQMLRKRGIGEVGKPLSRWRSGSDDVLADPEG